jgi:NADH:ubiquinone oxidoreductase subunit K
MLGYYISSILVAIFGYISLLLNKKNLLFFLIYLEIIYNGIILSLLCIGYNSYELSSIIYFFVSIALVAAESVVGLVLSILYQKSGNNLDLENLVILNG